MTQLSGYWTTSGTPSGDQQSSYTQAQLAKAAGIFAACNGWEGVASDYLNELAGTSPSSLTTRLNTGGAIVDGLWYYNDSATLDLTHDSTLSIRTDMVVLRASWSAFTVRATIIKGTDGSATPPSIIQTSGTTYDIALYEAAIDSGGNVVLTDVRTFGQVGTNGIEDGSVTLAKMAASSVDTSQLVADSVDDTKAGDRMAPFYRRQGGSSTVWTTAGTTTYTPGAILMQGGMVNVNLSSSNTGYTVITFPTAFAYAPIVYATASDAKTGGDPGMVCLVDSSFTTTTQCVVNMSTPDGTSISGNYRVSWLAIGTEV